MDRIELTLLRDEADEVREILRPHVSTGIRVTERRSWWFWVRFDITGAPPAIAGVRRALGEWDTEKAIQNAW